MSTFFAGGKFRQFLNPGNPAGFKGEICTAFGELIAELHGGKSWIQPKAFKDVVDKHFEQFEGDEQHDAIEFLNVMMDALHEDLRKNCAQPSMQRRLTTVLKNTDYEK